MCKQCGDNVVNRMLNTTRPQPPPPRPNKNAAQGITEMLFNFKLQKFCSSKQLLFSSFFLLIKNAKCSNVLLRRSSNYITHHSEIGYDRELLL